MARSIIGSAIGSAISGAINSSKKPSGSSSSSSSRPSSRPSSSSGSSSRPGGIAGGMAGIIGNVVSGVVNGMTGNSSRPSSSGGSSGGGSSGGAFGTVGNIAGNIAGNAIGGALNGVGIGSGGSLGSSGSFGSFNPDVDYSVLGSNQMAAGASWQDVLSTINARDQKIASSSDLSQYKDDDWRALAMSYVNQMRNAEEMAQAELDAQQEREAQLQAYYDAMANQISQQYDQLLPGVNQSYDESARQAYINARLAQRDLPEQLAAAGLAGQGATESSIVAQNNAYNAAYNQNELARQNALQQINNNKLSALAGNATSAAQAMVDLGTQLAAERQQILAQQQAAQQNVINNYLNYGQLTGNLGVAPTLSAQELAANNAYNNEVLQMQQQEQGYNQAYNDFTKWFNLFQAVGRVTNQQMADALGLPIGTTTRDYLSMYM